MTQQEKGRAETLDGPKIAAIAEAARQTLGCRAVVLVVIGNEYARTAVANPTMPMADALNCAVGSIYAALQSGGGVQLVQPDGKPR